MIMIYAQYIDCIGHLNTNAPAGTIFSSPYAIWFVILHWFPSCSTKPSQRREVCALGEAGASRGRPISLRPNQSAAAAWMKEHDLAFVNPKGKLVLNSSSLIFTTLLSRPEKVKDPVNPLDRSLWSLRRSLLGEGWLKADSGKHASVGMQKFNYKCEHHAYYAILLQRIHICLSSVWISMHFIFYYFV